MADPKNETNPNAPGEMPSDEQLADVGIPNPQAIRDLAKNLPEKDRVQKATKAGMLADTAQDEAKAKAQVVDASPNADQTPSGTALKKVTGIANDTERGEAYQRERAAKRWGY